MTKTLPIVICRIFHAIVLATLLAGFFSNAFAASTITSRLWLMPQTIIAGNAIKTYGDAPFVPAAIASSGLEVSYSSADNSIAQAFQDVADGNKWKLRVNKAGTVNITASEAGGNGYDAANNVVFSLEVTPVPITITANDISKTYGTTITGAPGMTAYTITSGALVNSEVIGSITIAYGTGAAATASVGNYTGQVTPSAATGGTFTPGNYIITYATGNIVVNKATLTITALGVTKVPGITITGGSGSTAYKASGLQNGQDAGTVTITYGAGAIASDPPDIYVNQVSASALTGGTITASNYTINYVSGDLVVGTSTITVNVAGGALQLLTTSFGSASGTTTFTVSGSNLSNDITATPPAGFEVSNNHTGPFGPTVTLPQNGGGVGTTNIYVRLTATTPVANNYNGNVVLSSPGAISQNIATTTSIVNAVPLTITASSVNKIYGDVLTGAAGSTAYSITGGALKNGNTVSSVTIAYGTGATAGAAVGTYTGRVTPSAAVGANGFLASNYNITYAPANIIVTPKTLMVTALASTKVYDKQTTSLVTPSVSGLITGDVVTAGPVESYDSPNVNTTSMLTPAGIAINGSTTITNYTVNYVPINTGIITTATATVTAQTDTKIYDKTTASSITPVVTGLASGDVAGTAPIQTYDNADVATAKTLTAAGLVINDGNGGNNYTIAYVNNTTGIISVAPVTVTAVAVNKTYGDTDPALTYNFTPALFTGDSFTGALSRATGENVGAHAITQNTLALNSNYALTFAGDNLTIGTKAITATAAPKTKTYGDADPALTYSFTPALISGDSFTGALSRTTGENVGAHAITQNTLALNSNYALTFAGDNLTIGTKAITATAAPKTKTYGDADPALTYSFTPALISGDSFTGALSRTTGENVGAHAITQNTLALNSNYALTFAGDNLTIGTKAITATAAPKTKTYGDADPALTYSFTPALISGDSFTGALSRATGENVGAHAITQNTLALNSNYALTFAGDNLTIGTKAITATAAPKTKTYGDADPALTYSFTPALISGDSFTGALSRTTGENVGAHAITQNTLALNSNYALTFAGDNLTIGTKAITATAAPKTKTYGDADPALTYSFTPALISGDSFTGALSRATGENVGAHAITQNTLALNSNYSLSYTGNSLSISKAVLTVTAANNTKVYGAANPALTVLFSGFTGGDTPASLNTQPTATTTAITASPVNSYPITASGGASSNYIFNYIPATLTVTKAALLITADNKNKPYGTANPVLTASHAGFVNGDDATGLITAPALTTTATLNSAAGSYPISASGAAANNYTISYSAGALTIANVTLTITANNQTKVYGAANPALSVTYSGFVNNDTQANLTTVPGITTAATSTSGAGTYPIIPSGAVIPGYTIVYIPGTLTIGKAPLTITADNKARLFGTANPILTVNYSGFVNGDTQASLTTIATAATNATPTTAPGSYAITTGGAASTNYAVSYTNGTLTIIPIANAAMANLTVSTGKLSPGFAPGVFAYRDSVGFNVDNITLTTNFDPTASATINGAPVPNGSQAYYLPIVAGNNTITTTITAQDGITKNTYTIVVYKALSPEAIIPANIITPNGDGKNDTWFIRDIELYPKNKVTIYDQAGRTVYTRAGYKNDWAGTVNGAALAQGTYYYIIDFGAETHPAKGYISIITSK